MNTPVKFASENQSKTARRLLYHEAYERPNEVFLLDGQNKFREVVILGEHETVPNDIHGLTVRRNLTLSNESGVFLQKLGPRNESAHGAMLEAMMIGRQRFDQVLQRCSMNKTATDRELRLACAVKDLEDDDKHISIKQATGDEPLCSPDLSNVTDLLVSTTRSSAASTADGLGSAGLFNDSFLDSLMDDLDDAAPADASHRNGHFHLGVWYGQGSRFATTTADTRQAKQDDAAVVHVLRFMAWLRVYIDKFVEPLTRPTALRYCRRGRKGQSLSDVPPSMLEPILCPAFLSSLAHREGNFVWLSKEVPVAKTLCHRLYNVCSPFQGFSGKPHCDKGDDAPTVLLNFGYARLHLPEYNAAVDLQPGDVVFFDAGVQHYTTPHPQHPGLESERWAISCFFQKRVDGHWQPTKYPTRLDMERQLQHILQTDREPEQRVRDLKNAKAHAQRKRLAANRKADGATRPTSTQHPVSEAIPVHEQRITRSKRKADDIHTDTLASSTARNGETQKKAATIAPSAVRTTRSAARPLSSL